MLKESEVLIGITKLHGTIFQKGIILIITAVRPDLFDLQLLCGFLILRGWLCD
jgi:hypothetical protein